MSTMNSIFDKLFITRHRLYVDQELDLRQAFHHSTSFTCRKWTRTNQSSLLHVPDWCSSSMSTSLRADFRRRHHRGRWPTPRRAGLPSSRGRRSFSSTRAGPFAKSCRPPNSYNFWTSPFPNAALIYLDSIPWITSNSKAFIYRYSWITYCLYSN